MVDDVGDRGVDVHTLDRDPSSVGLELNDIGRVRLHTPSSMALEPYAATRATGAFVLIDEATNHTVGAGMILNGFLAEHQLGRDLGVGEPAGS